MALETISNSVCSDWLEVQEPWHFRESDETCPVCTGNIIRDVVKKICGHNYHATCLLSWRKSEQEQSAKREYFCPKRKVLAIKEQGAMDLEELEDKYWEVGALDLVGLEAMVLHIDVTSADFEACFAHLLCQSPSPRAPTSFPDAERPRVSEDFPIATHQSANVQLSCTNQGDGTI